MAGFLRPPHEHRRRGPTDLLGHDSRFLLGRAASGTRFCAARPQVPPRNRRRQNRSDPRPRRRPHHHFRPQHRRADPGRGPLRPRTGVYFSHRRFSAAPLVRRLHPPHQQRRLRQRQYRWRSPPLSVWPGLYPHREPAHWIHCPVGGGGGAAGVLCCARLFPRTAQPSYISGLIAKLLTSPCLSPSSKKSGTSTSSRPMGSSRCSTWICTSSTRSRLRRRLRGCALPDAKFASRSAPSPRWTTISRPNPAAPRFSIPLPKNRLKPDRKSAAASGSACLIWIRPSRASFTSSALSLDSPSPA